MSKSRKKPLISATLCLFLVAVSFAVIGRIISIHIIVHEMCDPLLFTGRLPDQDISGIEWFMIVGGLLFVAQLMVMLGGILDKRFGWMDFSLGTVNVLLALFFIAHWLTLWSYYSPQHPASRFVDSVLLSSPFVSIKPIYLGSSEFRSPADDPNWDVYEPMRYSAGSADLAIDAPSVYQHRASGVLASREIVFQCLPANIQIANAERLIATGVIVGDRDLNLATGPQYDWVYRDTEWRIVHVYAHSGTPTGAALLEEYRQNPSPIDADEFFDLLAAEQQEPDGEPKPEMTFEEFVDAYMAEMERKAERRERQAR
ncbi:hypothetical protein [Ponticaulis sp.]|uniref:hypothetical protein n=1 Tax=Ponticaulis sp. TaxID=2020902 RepID=UPI0026233178|nr:hypothetical protein [Ponticaulis sp.]MDF1681075.1 hypothetical protein [Ponticaulis sp.]